MTNAKKLVTIELLFQVKDPNMPLMAPGLVTGKVQVTNGNSNGFGTNGHEESDFSRTIALKSEDFNKLRSGHIEEFTSR